jgi:COMPASS component SPP1
MRIQLDGRGSRSDSRVSGATEAGPNARSRTSSVGFGKGRHKIPHLDGNDDEGSNDGYEEEEDELEADELEGDQEIGNNIGSRGGILTRSDLKAAVSLVGSVQEFRKLGENVLGSQLPEVKARFGVFENDGGEVDVDVEAENNEFTPDERQQIQALRTEKSRLRHRDEMLRDRDKFLALVRQQGKQILESLRQATPKGATVWKDICGFDPRLSWSDEEFDEWRLSESGKRALNGGALDPPQSSKPEVDGAGDTEMTDGNEDEVSKIAGDVCVKRRCEQHKQWLKVQQQDILFERSTARDHLRKCEGKSKEVLDRVVLRVYGNGGG